MSLQCLFPQLFCRLGSERFEACEVLYQPSLNDIIGLLDLSRRIDVTKGPGFADLVFDAIHHADEDIRPEVEISLKFH